MKLIEFVGMPRSGKSTQAELLKKELETRGKSVLLLTDREHMARLAVPPQESLAFALSYYGQLLDSYYTYKDKADVMIIDRGWSDVAVWADVYRAMKVVTEEESDALVGCFGRFARLATAVVVIRLAPEVSLERHRATLHEQVDEVAMNPDWLTALAAAYETRKSQFTNPLEVDGTQEPEEAHAEIVAFLETTGSV
jgi:thymidylate kinase